MFLEKDSHNRSQGWIEVICGSMFSGKTEELIRRLKRAKIAKNAFYSSTRRAYISSEALGKHQGF